MSKAFIAKSIVPSEKYPLKAQHMQEIRNAQYNSSPKLTVQSKQYEQLIRDMFVKAKLEASRESENDTNSLEEERYNRLWQSSPGDESS